MREQTGSAGQMGAQDQQTAENRGSIIILTPGVALQHFIDQLQRRNDPMRKQGMPGEAGSDTESTAQ